MKTIIIGSINAKMMGFILALGFSIFCILSAHAWYIKIAYVYIAIISMALIIMEVRNEYRRNHQRGGIRTDRDS